MEQRDDGEVGRNKLSTASESRPTVVKLRSSMIRMRARSKSQMSHSKVGLNYTMINM